MNYISTRGQAHNVGFSGALMTGLAPDGGLYVPDAWPQLAAKRIATLAGRPYAAAAASIIGLFTGGEPDDASLARLVEAAYADFTHAAKAPLKQIGDNLFVLELFHGPTFAFKDFAMQALSRLMDLELERNRARATILGATSGDTGAAAIEAFKGRENTDIFILYPHGRVSETQRRQMTAVPDENVHALAVEGSFDDCQAIVKTLFNDAALNARFNLSAVNSINWARIAAQIPYYFTAATALGAPLRPVSFAVPTGNFGDIFAGYAAMRMGLPIKRLAIAANMNDILVRTLESGRYEPRGVAATTSPSMDIQISSNFERLLFDACGRDAARIRAQMRALKDEGGFNLSEAAELAFIRRAFAAYRVSEDEVAATIGAVYSESGYMADPHTAVGIAAARRLLSEGESGPVIALATAHPAKFPEAVSRAAGTAPAIPARLQSLFEQAERFTVMNNSASGVAAFIAARSRAASNDAYKGLTA